ncbi:MAG: hypothetical protein GY926_27495, partial [bacterium]|nr:hypothetical protein [bacterium]
GSLQFAQLPPPSNDDVEKLLRRIAARIDRLVQRHRDEAVDDDTSDALQQSLAEAVQPPRRHPWETHTSPPKPQQPRCFALDGYSLHANVAVAADDRRGLRRLLRYGGRAALAARRVSLNEEGMVVYKLRKPTSTGRSQVVMTPQQFIRRLAALTPPPWLNLSRFHGVFASNHSQRNTIAQRVAEQSDPNDDPFVCPPLRKPTDSDDPSSDAPHKHLRIAWSELLRRTFDDPLVCPRCQGRMRLVAVVKDPDAIAAILAHPAHRDDDPDPQSGPDPPQPPLDLDPQRELFESP